LIQILLTNPLLINYPTPQPNFSKPPFLSRRLFLPFYSRRPFSYLILNTRNHTPATIDINTSPSNPHSSPYRGGRCGRNSQSPCPFFYVRYLPN
jgi:hypothetical protein